MKHITNITGETLTLLEELELTTARSVESLGQASSRNQQNRLIRQSRGNLDFQFMLHHRLQLRRRDILTSEAGRALANRLLKNMNLGIINHIADPLYRDAMIITAKNALIRENSTTLTIQIPNLEWGRIGELEIAKFEELADKHGIDPIVQAQRIELLEEYFETGVELYSKNILTYVQLDLQKKYHGEK